MAKRKNTKATRGRKPPARSPLSKKLQAARIVYQEGGVYQLKITLLDVEPPIWRRVLVADCTLEELHFIIQSVMGWENDHLYEFEAGAKRYAGTDPMGMMGEAEASRVSLSKLAPMVATKFYYTYDFGDDWRHEVLVEAYGPPEAGREPPVCLAGERACPPEDVGGTWGYADLVEALKDPEHERHEEFMDWLEDFDPEAFDLDAVNRELKGTPEPDSQSHEEEDEDDEGGSPIA
jgi:hypothetical protein